MGFQLLSADLAPEKSAVCRHQKPEPSKSKVITCAEVWKEDTDYRLPESVFRQPGRMTVV